MFVYIREKGAVILGRSNRLELQSGFKKGAHLIAPERVTSLGGIFLNMLSPFIGESF